MCGFNHVAGLTSDNVISHQGLTVEAAGTPLTPKQDILPPVGNVHVKSGEGQGEHTEETIPDVIGAEVCVI